jgi:AcrR family transcriptional regulator
MFMPADRQLVVLPSLPGDLVPGESPFGVRDRILEQALHVFAATGYAGASMQEISVAAGVTKPTLYYYFGSKAGLYRAVVESAFAQRFEALRHAAARTEGQGIAATLHALMDAALLFAREHDELMRICYATAFSNPREIPAEIRPFELAQKNFDLVLGLIGEAAERGELNPAADRRALAVSIYSQFFVCSMLVVLHSEKWDPLLGHDLVRLFLEGAGPRSESPAVAAERPAG